MLQLLFDHLHLEHLSSVYLYGTLDLHRAFLTLSDSQFLLLTSHPKTPNPLLSLLFFLCPRHCSLRSSSLSLSIWFLGQCYIIVVTVLVLSQDVPNHFPSSLFNIIHHSVPSFLLCQATPLLWHGLANRCAGFFSGIKTGVSMITVSPGQEGEFYLPTQIHHIACFTCPLIKNFHNKLSGQ